MRSFKGGTLGLVSWNGGGSFNNVIYSDGTEVKPPVTDDPVTPPATDDPVTPPVTDDKPDVTDKSETPADSTDSSPLLPILIGVGAIVVIGAIVAVVLVKKKK